MTDHNANTVTAAATSIMQVLEPLSPEERTRVLHSVAALFGVVTLPTTVPTTGAAKPGTSNERGADTSAKPRSIVEFLKEKRPATNAQRFAAFAYFREHVEAEGSRFSRDDLKPYFEAAKIRQPDKYDRDYNKAVAEGWIHDAGANSYLTQAGEAAVEAGFGGKGKPRGRAAKKKPAAKAASKQSD